MLSKNWKTSKKIFSGLMIKYNLPCNKYFFANRNKLFYQLSKNLKELYLKDEFGYFLIVSELNKKTLKAGKVLSTFPFKLKNNKKYVIFINYNSKSLILEKRLSLKKHQEILFLENSIDNRIYICEVK